MFGVKSVRVVSYLNSPPKEIISSLKLIITFLKTSVPMCALDKYVISLSAPHLWKIFNTSFILLFLSLILVFNLPSEKVPAPPSPKHILLFSKSIPFSKKFSTSTTLSSTFLPRSIISGLYPSLARKYKCANIVSADVDSSASKLNYYNRLLMLLN